MGMLKTCKEDQMCTMYGIVTFEQKPVKEKEVKSEFQKVEKSLYHIPQETRKQARLRTILSWKMISLLPLILMSYAQNKILSIAINLHYRMHQLTNRQSWPWQIMWQQQICLCWRWKADRHNLTYWNDYWHRGPPPIAKKPYTPALKHYDWVKERIDKLLEAGVIRDSQSSWSAPIVVVPKGDSGKRLYVDFRALNKITRTYVWPMPRVEDIFAKLGKAKFYTTVDLRSRYHHITLDKESIKKTAFFTPFGKSEYLKVPFGLVQAPAYFENLMNKDLNGLNFTLSYFP